LNEVSYEWSKKSQNKNLEVGADLPDGVGVDPSTKLFLIDPMASRWVKVAGVDVWISLAFGSPKRWKESGELIFLNVEDPYLQDKTKF
jgi:hypothetical protein